MQEPAAASTPSGSASAPPGSASEGPATPAAAGASRKAKAFKYGFVFAFPFAMVMLLVGIYVSSMHSPQPHNLPVAIVGSGQQAEQSVQALDSAEGSPADARLLHDTDEAKQLLHDREIAGALALPDDPQAKGASAVLYTAQAAGASQTMSVTQVLSPIAAGAHLDLKQQDVAPLHAEDASGMGVMFMSVGLMLAGYMSITVASSGAPELMRLKRLLPVLAGWSALMSGVIWTIAGPLVGAVQGHALEVWGIGALAIFAVGLSQTFLSRLFGPLAVLPGLALFMFLGMPASNLALSIHTLPGMFGALHQVLPLPAAGETLRAVLYFDGDGAGSHLVTLGIWAVAAFLLTAGFDALRRRRGRARQQDATRAPVEPTRQDAPAGVPA